jgi:hypothetical protein
MARKKGSNLEWVPMPQIRVATVDEAKARIRERSDVIDAALEFAIKVTTFEKFSERNAPAAPEREGGAG